MRRVFMPALFALSIMALISALMEIGNASAQATSPVDYDADDDGLIEVFYLEQLNAMRYDLDGDGRADNTNSAEAYASAFPSAQPGMGCPDSHCRGYELTRNLDFDSRASYMSGSISDKWTGGAGWLPIGLLDNPFDATFAGNDFTIANLYISRRGFYDTGAAGLFGISEGDISRVGVVDADVTGGDQVGALAGWNIGRIAESWATGSVSGNDNVGGLAGFSGFGGSSGSGIVSSYAEVDVNGTYSVGGLVGLNEHVISKTYATGGVSGGQYAAGGLVGINSGGRIFDSYATGDVLGHEAAGGGLVGDNRNNATIAASYATGDVSGSYSMGGLIGIANGGALIASYASGEVSSAGGAVGGLVGESLSGSVTIASYASGKVSGGDLVGGLIGRNDGTAITVDSYWDTITSRAREGVGEGPSQGAQGKTTEQLKLPTDYTGIYAAWHSDLDNEDRDFDETTGVDDFWDFGTSGQYPALKVDFDDNRTATWREFGSQRPTPTPVPTPVPTSTYTPEPTATPRPAPVPASTYPPEPTITLGQAPAPTPTYPPEPTITPTPLRADTPTPPPASAPVAELTDRPASGLDEPEEPESAGGCFSPAKVSAGTSAANLLLMAAPLGMIGGVRYVRRRRTEGM